MNIKIQNQWKIIKYLAKTFEDNAIPYHFDGSTAVFVQGIGFDMDDIDIVLPFDKVNEIRELFKEYKPSEIGCLQTIGLKYFHFYIDDEKIHCLFYEGSYETFRGEDVEITKDGQKIWAKSLDFYLRHAKKDDVLVPRIHEMFKLSELILVTPSKALEEKILEYKKEYLDFGEAAINGSCGLARYNNFDEWLEMVLSIEKDKLRNNVHASTFFSVRKSDNKIIGTVQLRHSLTDELEKHGGHIGYGIRPTERKKSYGKQQLLLILEIAKNMKIPKVMIICDKDNIASSHTAISCGGILTNENFYEGKEQQIYWIYS